MRKSIIYCLAAMLLIGLVPIGASAAEPEVYEITIYPNKNNNYNIYYFSFRSLGDEKLKLKDVDVYYSINEQDNTIDINFSDDIFVDRIISTGNTIHNNVVCDEDYIINVNDNLDTDVIVGSRVNNISISYENIQEVDSITIQSAEYDFSGGLLDNVIFIGDVSDLKNMTDNDINTKTSFLYMGDKTISYSFDDVKDIGNMKYYMSGKSFTAGSILLQFYDELDNLIYEYKVNTGADKVGYQEVDINLNDVKKVSITINPYGNTKYIHEFNLYEREPLSEVIGLEYLIDNNSVLLSWTNPEFIGFTGVNIYRNNILIKESYTGTSYTDAKLDPGEYIYKLTTVDSNGNESEGVSVSVTIEKPPESAPTPVKNIRIINRTSTGGAVTWDLNPTIENVEKYVVYVNGEKHGEIEAPPYPLEGLEEGKTYTISVRAINGYGASEPPTTVTYTPTKLAEIGESIKVGDIFSYLAVLFTNMWPLLALVLAIIISPKLYNLFKSNVT